jgi:LacI family transcriptional regulator, galactose operon repressor
MPKRATEVPTLTTVARLANVSVASASRVLNGIRTNPDTLARVLEAAEAVGYAPNAAARSLRSRRTGQIAFAMPDVANPVYTTMVSSIQAVAREHDVRLLLHSTDGDVADELALLRDLKQRYVDGLILCSLRFTNAHVPALARAAVPVAVIGRPPKEARVDTVRPNSRRGAFEAVRHLHEVGRRRIAFVNGPEATTPGHARRLGYLDGLRACGLERDDGLVEVADDFMVEPGARATARLLERASPDAIFCANDLLALGALNSLRAAGLDVPRDVAVVGMDDSSVAAHTWPPLTSVDLGSAERGRLAADLLLKRIDRPNRRPRTLVVEPQLVVRNSSEVAA